MSICTYIGLQVDIYTIPLQRCWYTVYSVNIICPYFSSHQTRQSPLVPSIGIRAVKMDDSAPFDVFLSVYYPSQESSQS